MISFDQARQRERGYHVAFYAKHTLGDENTWIAAPAPYAIDSFALIPKRPKPRALDLGAGIGRHVIPLAEHLGAGAEIVCVDMLESAIEALQSNTKKAHVAAMITGVVADVESYEPQGMFDYVLSVSCIEHVSSKYSLIDLIGRLQRATNPGGVHCFMLATDHVWTDAVTGKSVEPVVEQNLSSAEVIKLLKDCYAGWKMQDISTKAWEVTETVDGRDTICGSTCVQFIGSNSGEE